MKILTMAYIQYFPPFVDYTDTLKFSMEKLEKAKWRKTDDFIPLLSVPLEQLDQLNADDITHRIYEMSEKFSVCH